MSVCEYAFPSLFQEFKVLPFVCLGHDQKHRGLENWAILLKRFRIKCSFLRKKNLWILSHSGNISVIYSNQSHWVQLSSTIFFMVSFIIRAPLSSTSYIFRILAFSTTRNVFKIYRNDQRHVQQAFWLYLVSVWKRKNLNEFVCVVGC